MTLQGGGIFSDSLYGLNAAFRLAIGRTEGVAHIRNAQRVAATSFLAAILCLPFFILLRWWDWHQEWPLHPRHDAVVSGVGYIIGWSSFALASRSLTILMGRQILWPRFIATWNWCGVVQYILLSLGMVPALLGAPDIVGNVSALVMLFWVIWIEWVVARLTLGLARLPACAFVALDLLISLMLSSLVTPVAAS